MKLAGPLNKKSGGITTGLKATCCSPTVLRRRLEHLRGEWKEAEWDKIGHEKKIVVCQNMKKNLDDNNSNNLLMKKKG